MDAHGNNIEATSEDFWDELYFQNDIKSSSCNYFSNGVDLETIYENCASFNGDNGSEFWMDMSDCVKEPKNEHIDQENCASFNGDNGSEFWVGMSDCVKEPKNEHIDQENCTSFNGDDRSEFWMDMSDCVKELKNEHIDQENCASFNGDNISEFWVGTSDCVKELKNEHIDQDNIDQGMKLELEKEGETDLSMEKKIYKLFHLPIDEAAIELGIGVTTLRNKLRKLEIERWPNRKLNSLQTVINNIQKLSEQGLMNEEQVNDTIKMVKEKIALIYRSPNTKLEENIEKLRQFCFKNNFKMKKKTN